MDLGLVDVCFMDDNLGWANSILVLQKRVDALVATLDSRGLKINPLKGQLLTRGDTQGRTLKIFGHVLRAIPDDQGPTAVNIPCGLDLPQWIL